MINVEYDVEHVDNVEDANSYLGTEMIHPNT